MGSDLKYKVIFLGSIGVGKTSIFYRLTENTWQESRPNAVDEMVVDIPMNQGKISVLMMDTAGQELFRTLTSSYYRNADLILVVYDKSNIVTTEDLQEFFVDVGRYAKRAKIILIGNKSDIENPAITTEQGQKIATEFSVPFVELSAKNGDNVEKLKELMMEQLLQTNQNNSPVVDSNSKKKKKAQNCLIC